MRYFFLTGRCYFFKNNFRQLHFKKQYIFFKSISFFQWSNIREIRDSLQKCGGFRKVFLRWKILQLFFCLLHQIFIKLCQCLIYTLMFIQKHCFPIVSMKWVVDVFHVYQPSKSLLFIFSKNVIVFVPKIQGFITNCVGWRQLIFYVYFEFFLNAWSLDNFRRRNINEQRSWPPLCNIVFFLLCVTNLINRMNYVIQQLFLIEIWRNHYKTIIKIIQIQLFYYVLKFSSEVWALLLHPPIIISIRVFQPEFELFVVFLQREFSLGFMSSKTNWPSRLPRPTYFGQINSPLFFAQFEMLPVFLHLA